MHGWQGKRTDGSKGEWGSEFFFPLTLSLSNYFLSPFLCVSLPFFCLSIYYDLLIYLFVV
jgi:hypothetical protein